MDHATLIGEVVSVASADTTKFVEEVGMDMEGILVGCNWRAKYTDCRSLSRTTFDARRGQCFTMDSPQFQRVQISEGMGLIIVVDLKKVLISSTITPQKFPLPAAYQEYQWTYNPEIADGVNVRIMDYYDPITVGDLWAPAGSVTKVHPSSFQESQSTSAGPLD